jgi:hypothetical protein
VKDYDKFLMDTFARDTPSNQTFDIVLIPTCPYQVNEIVFQFGHKISRQIGYLERATIFSKTNKSMFLMKNCN